MALAHRDGRRAAVPDPAAQVYDITGAGDMVHERAGHGRWRPGPITTPAIRLANVAGGLEVEKIGVATVTRDEILRDLLHAAAAAGGRKRATSSSCLQLSREIEPPAQRAARRLHQRLLRRAARRARAVPARGPRAGRRARGRRSTATPACGR